MKKSKQQTSLFNTMEPAEPKQIEAQAKTIKPEIKAHNRISSSEQIYKNILKGLKSYFEKHHFTKAVLGVSGGVDSALVLKIAADALGPANVTALVLPELGLTNPENIEHAKILCQFLGVGFHYQPINSFLTDFSITPWKPGTLSQMNTKARIRAALLYSFSNTENALVLGTSNKSEILLGYGTKYGDLACDVQVIGDLLKTEVVKLADFVGLPPEIVYKTPTAELAPGQTDETELGATYEDLDKVLSRVELGIKGCVEYGMPSALVQLVFQRIEQNKHKSEPVFVIKAHE